MVESVRYFKTLDRRKRAVLIQYIRTIPNHNTSKLYQKRYITKLAITLKIA